MQKGTAPEQCTKGIALGAMHFGAQRPCTKVCRALKTRWMWQLLHFTKHNDNSGQPTPDSPAVRDPSPTAAFGPWDVHLRGLSPAGGT